MLFIKLPEPGDSFPKVVQFGTAPTRNVQILTPEAYHHIVKAKKASDEGDEVTYDKEIRLAYGADLVTKTVFTVKEAKLWKKSKASKAFSKQ